MTDVTVVIATRNRRELLREAIESVRNQKGVEFEIIVVNDASEDDTRDFISRETGVRAFNQEVRGERSKARNVGLANARGRYVMFLDDDDLLRPHALATLSRPLDQNPDAVASAGARWDWFVHEKWGRRDSHPRFAQKRSMYEAFLFGWSAISGQCLYRTDVVRDVGGYNEEMNYVEDRDLWLKVSQLGKVVLRPEIVMTYRIPRVQDRPADIVERREQNFRRAIDRLPEAERSSAFAIREASALVQQAEDQLKRRDPIGAIRSCARAVKTKPDLMLSPLVGGWVIRRLARSAGHLLKLH